MEWLQEHMRKILDEAEEHTPKSNVLSLLPQISPAEDVGVRALELVERAIKYISDTQDEVAARHARAETLARNAIERLKSAEERVYAAESAHQAAVVRIADVCAQLREAEIQLERTAANATSAQTRISAAEERARVAEMRAIDAENALKRIEAVIRTQIFETRPSSRRREIVAA